MRESLVVGRIKEVWAQAWRGRPSGACGSSPGDVERRDCDEVADDASVVPPSRGPALAPVTERQAQYRGAATERIGEILDVANSMVAVRRYIPGKRFGLADWRSPEEALATSWSEEGGERVSGRMREKREYGRGVPVCSLRGLRPRRSQTGTPRPYRRSWHPRKKAS